MRAVRFIDRCREVAADYQARIVSQMRAIELGRLTPLPGELERLKQQYAEHAAFVEQYAHIP